MEKVKNEEGALINLGNGKMERNRRLKLGITAMVLVVLAYALAKITNDTSGDWWRFSLLIIGLALFIGGYITVTDVLGKKGLIPGI